MQSSSFRLINQLDMTTWCLGIRYWCNYLSMLRLNLIHVSENIPMDIVIAFYEQERYGAQNNWHIKREKSDHFLLAVELGIRRPHTNDDNIRPKARDTYRKKHCLWYKKAMCVSWTAWLGISYFLDCENFLWWHYVIFLSVSSSLVTVLVKVYSIHGYGVYSHNKKIVTSIIYGIDDCRVDSFHRLQWWSSCQRDKLSISERDCGRKKPILFRHDVHRCLLESIKHPNHCP